MQKPGVAHVDARPEKDGTEGKRNKPPVPKERKKNKKELIRRKWLVLPSPLQSRGVAFLALGSHFYTAQQDSMR